MATVGGVVSAYFRRTWSIRIGRSRPVGVSKLSERTAARFNVVPTAPWKDVKGMLICRQPLKFSVNEAVNDTGLGAA